MNIKNLFTHPQTKINDVMKKIDENGFGISLIVDVKTKSLQGIITDSDIRRSLMEGKRPTTEAKEIMNKSPLTFPEDIDKQTLALRVRTKEILEKFPEHGILLFPIVNKKNVPIDIYFVSRKGYIGNLNETKKSKKVSSVLVVGGAGYLGSILSEKLLRKGYKVKVLDNLTFGDVGIRHLFAYPNFEFIYGDMRNIKKLTEATRDIDAVIHLAAIVGDPACAINPQDTIQSNYLSTKTLAEICKFSQINRFIFASTCSVYGASEEVNLLTEESPLNPVSLYADMKLKSEQAILEIADQNFQPTIFRMGTLFGNSYRMRFDLVVNILTIRAIKEKEFRIFGGNQWRALCYVSDAAEAYIKALESPIDVIGNQIFNIVGENKKIIDIGRTVKTVFPKSNMIIDKEKEDIRNYKVDGSKFISKTGFVFSGKIIDGVLEIKSMSDSVKNYKDKKYSNYLNRRNKYEN